MARLSILYVDTESFWRGGQEQLFSLMIGMRDRGNRVCLAAPPNSPLTAKAREAKIPAYPFKQRSELSPRAFFKLRSILNARHFDIIHFNTPRAVAAGGLAACGFRVPVRISARRVNFPLSSAFSRLKYNWLQDGIITVSESIRETLVAGGVKAAKVAVIYEGVDLGWIDSQKPPSVDLAGDGLVVGTVAHFSPEKGHRTLIEAAAALKNRFPEVVFVLVGDGGLRPEIERNARQLEVFGQVRFVGFRSDWEALMKHFDIFCLPSLSEGLSSAILTAMGNSLPVVATGVGGIPELVAEGETGLLVIPNRPLELASALARLLSSPELRKRMGAAGRRRIETHFTLQRKLNQTEALYARLLATRRFD
jgi:glycosyltransferase involved in cell wall biosynthesis